MAHRIVLVREWDTQTTGSGCCGRVGGFGHEFGDTGEFRHAREGMVAMGAVYNAVRAAFPDADEVEITVADPRNTVWLVPAIWRDARRRGMSRAEAARQVARGVGNGSVVCDGRTLFSGTPPAPGEAVAAIHAELSSAAPSGA